MHATPVNTGVETATLIRTSTLLESRRLDYWRDMISSTFVALDCSIPSQDNFSGLLESNELKDIQFSRVVAGAQRVVRSPRRIRQAPDDCILVSVQRNGRGYVAQEDRVARLDVGDFALYDSSHPYELNFDSPFEQLVLRIPRQHLSRRIACPERLTATAFNSSHGVAAIVSSFMLHIYEQLPFLEPDTVTGLHQALIDLLAAVLAGPSAQPKPTATRLMMRQRIKSFVETRLSDCTLDCKKIAAAHGISVRYLHKLFEDDEIPLSDCIRLRRLERARVAIESSPATGQSITQIAYDWGFKDPSHFSRAFRNCYGMAPSDLRRVPRANQANNGSILGVMDGSN